MPPGYLTSFIILYGTLSIAPALDFYLLHTNASESRSVVSDSLGLQGLYSPWNSLAQNTGVGSLSLLQEIFPTQKSNQGLLRCRWILYQLRDAKWFFYLLRRVESGGKFGLVLAQSVLRLTSPLGFTLIPPSTLSRMLILQDLSPLVC